jgi:hypothetical protein
MVFLLSNELTKKPIKNYSLLRLAIQMSGITPSLMELEIRDWRFTLKSPNLYAKRPISPKCGTYLIVIPYFTP